MQPIYPNCFDLLTTHGVIHNDLVGYITGTPSPYLQQYVAQRGGVPLAPAPAPGVPAAPQAQILQQPAADAYQKTQIHSEPPAEAPSLHSHNPKKNNIGKSIAMSLILSLGASLLLAKGIRVIKGTTVPPAPAGTPWYQRFFNLFKI